MKKKIKWIVILLVVVGFSYGLYNFSNPAQTGVVTDDTGTMKFQVTKEALVQTIEVKGKSSYENETFIYSPFGAEVKQWGVKDAQQVKKGEMLFRLDPTTLQNEIEQTEANIQKQKLENQLAEFRRNVDSESSTTPMVEEELKKKYVERESSRLQQELNSVTMGIQQKEIAQKREKIGEAQYGAPVSGIFLFDDPKKLPQELKNNERIGKIVDLNKLQLVTLVGEQDIFNIKPGMAVEVKMNALKNLKLKGKVVKVSKFAKATSTEQQNTNTNQAAQFEVIIGLEPNDKLIAGLSLTGKIETASKENAIVVPTVAVMREKDQQYVMLEKSKGNYERRNIKVGLETPEKVEVLEGLKDGDTVVLQ
ncbi:efflux RND transporter periplasmic adaptor subunit [Paenibacillus sp. 481]|uniref:efflux RND transporter periplasmic adaptor subunit n=1 Tax=Paenibacillus sp. 481 TaxID=2835869 RepID=UPI001E49CEA6|nr:efflux RND transporter periplasmic adaptor subunit [Paenibacillus sp. 481]UHA72644.1 efflux RND transporter periplasmic adaptor subunit [Paenibacillus sp. 481]